MGLRNRRTWNGIIMMAFQAAFRIERHNMLQESSCGVALVRPNLLITGTMRRGLIGIDLLTREERWALPIEKTGQTRIQGLDSYLTMLMVSDLDGATGIRTATLLEIGTDDPPFPVIGRWAWRNMTAGEGIVRRRCYYRLSTNGWLFVSGDGDSRSAQIQQIPLNEGEIILATATLEQYLFVLTGERIWIVDCRQRMLMRSYPHQHPNARCLAVSALSTPTMARIAIGGSGCIELGDMSLLLHGNETIKNVRIMNRASEQRIHFINQDCMAVVREDGRMEIHAIPISLNNPILTLPMDTDYVTRIHSHYPYLACDGPSHAIIVWQSFKRQSSSPRRPRN